MSHVDKPICTNNRRSFLVRSKPSRSTTIARFTPLNSSLINNDDDMP